MTQRSPRETDWLHAYETARADRPAPPARADRPAPPAQAYTEVIRHGTMSAGLFTPRLVDEQETHDQDELYVVLHGFGTVVRGDEKTDFQPGDLIFVPAGMSHRFEGFTDDLAVWAVFWGPNGGEAPAA